MMQRNQLPTSTCKPVLVASVLIMVILAWSFEASGSAPERGLLGYYPFSGNAEDASGNGNHGTIHRVNRERDVEGTPNGSYRWNSKKDRILLPIDINPVSLPQVTLVAWVYPRRHLDSMVVLSHDDGGGDRKIATTRKENKTVWAISDGANGYIGETPVQRNRWVFLAARYDNDKRTASIYVDGELTTGDAYVDMGTDMLWVGANPRGNNHFEAFIDEVYVYDRLLSVPQLEAIRALKTPDHRQGEEKDGVPVAYYYEVNVNRLVVRDKPHSKASQVGALSKGETIHQGEPVPGAEGGAGNQWLQFKMKNGKTGYCMLRYLDRKVVEQAPSSEEQGETALVKAFLEEHVQSNRWVFWVLLLLVLSAGMAGSIHFQTIDKAISQLTGSRYTNIAYFPLITGLCGFLMAFFMLISQTNVEYYLSENFTFWPYGYGFVTWLVWILVMVMSLFFVVLTVESLAGAGLVHGTIRIGIQAVLGICTFVTVLIVTAILIVVAIILMVIIFILGALATPTYRARRVIILR